MCFNYYGCFIGPTISKGKLALLKPGNSDIKDFLRLLLKVHHAQIFFILHYIHSFRFWLHFIFGSFKVQILLEKDIVKTH